MRIRPFVHRLMAPIALSAVMVGCGGSVAGAKRATWVAGLRIAAVVDLSGPRRDGAMVVAAAGRLSLLGRSGALRPFAVGSGGYFQPGGGEPYIALSSRVRVSGAGCSFPADAVYVLQLGAGVAVVDSGGRARPFARLPGPGLLNGIAFDQTGRFGHRLLVTSATARATTIYTIDCRGRVSTLTRTGPRVEGGIAVAPRTFGRFAGWLIAPDELSGRIYAVAPDGRSRVVAESGLPHGPDTGVESAGFVPPGFGRGWSALVADRRTPGNPHPGDDVVLRIGYRALARAGVRPGDLLIASEGGAPTDAVTCAASCRVRHVADGPVGAHVEGHVAFWFTG
jgi:hypothetical protein